MNDPFYGGPAGKQAGGTLFNQILFVESDSQIIDEVRDLLDLHFYDVVVAPNGPEAIRMIMRNTFDAVLCDMTMPAFPGEMFYHALQRIRPELCKKLISIIDSGENGKGGHPMGAISIWKPIDLQVLLDAIRSVLRKNQTIHETVEA